MKFDPHNTDEDILWNKINVQRLKDLHKSHSVRAYTNQGLLTWIIQDSEAQSNFDN